MRLLLLSVVVVLSWWAAPAQAAWKPVVLQTDYQRVHAPRTAACMIAPEPSECSESHYYGTFPAAGTFSRSTVALRLKADRRVTVMLPLNAVRVLVGYIDPDPVPTYARASSPSYNIYEIRAEPVPADGRRWTFTTPRFKHVASRGLLTIHFRSRGGWWRDYHARVRMVAD